MILLQITKNRRRSKAYVFETFNLVLSCNFPGVYVLLGNEDIAFFPQLGRVFQYISMLMLLKQNSQNLDVR